MQTRSVRIPVQQRWKAATPEKKGRSRTSAERKTRNGKQEQIVERKSDACDGDAEDETGLARSQEV